MEQNGINKNCPVTTTLQLIGGKYKSLILWHLMDHTLRFSSLRKLIPEATPKMLTQQLRELENDGLLNRVIYPVVPPKVEYSLTAKGEGIRPILQCMFEWGTEILRQKGLEPDCTMITHTDNRCCRESHEPI